MARKSFWSWLKSLRSRFGTRSEQRDLRKRSRLSIEGLETRLAPAANLTISNGATTNVTFSDLAGVRTFNTTANTAVLNVADIQSALLNGTISAVVITNDVGTQTGNITWANTASLNFNTIGATKSLTVTTSALGAPVGTGSLTFNGEIYDSSAGGESLNVTFNSLNTITINPTANNISVGAALIQMNANQDGTGAQGYATTTGALITTLAGGTGIQIKVNNGGGTGGANVGDLTTGGADISINVETAGGDITQDASTLLTTTTGTITFSGDDIGTSAANMLTQAATITANGGAGTGGTFITESDGASFTATATTSSIISLTSTTGTLTIGGATSTGTGAITLTADSMAISNSVTTSGAIQIERSSTGSISLGTPAIPSTLNLDQSELSNLNATTVRIGNVTGSATQNITIVSALTTASTTTTLKLIAGATDTLSQNPSATLTANGGAALNLALSAQSILMAESGNNFGNLAIVGTGTGNASVADSDGFVVSTVDSIVGINMGSNDLTLSSSGPVTDSQATIAGDVTLGGSGPYVLDKSTNAVSTLTSTGTNGVTFVNSTSLTIPFVDGISTSSNGDISITVSSGDLIVDGDVVANGAGNVTLINSSNLTTDDLIVNATVDSGSGNLSLQANDDIFLGSSAGAFIGQATTGTITLNADRNTADGVGSLYFGFETDFDPAFNVVVGNSGPGTITLTAAGIDVYIDPMNQPAATISGTGALVVQPSVGNAPIDLGTNTAIFSLTQFEIDSFQDGFTSIRIGQSAGTGTITITGSVEFDDSTTLSGGSIIDNGTIFTVGTSSGSGANLTLQARSTTIGASATDRLGVDVDGKLLITLSGAATNAYITSPAALNLGAVTGTATTTEIDIETTGVGSTLTLVSNVTLGSGVTTTFDSSDDLIVNSGVNFKSGIIDATAAGNIQGLGVLTTLTDDLSLFATGIGTTSALQVVVAGSLFVETTGTGTAGNITITTTAASLDIGGYGSDLGTVQTALFTNSNTTGVITVSSAEFDLNEDNVTITANDIDFDGGSGSVTGTGNLVVQPQSTTIDMNVGLALPVSTEFNFDATDIAALGNGFTSLTIGRSNGQNAITIGDSMTSVTFTDPVTIRAPVGNGSIHVDGKLIGTGDASITLDGPGATTTLNADIVTVNQPIMISDSVVLGTDILLDTNSGGVGTKDVTITGTIISESGETNDLTIDGNGIFGGLIGNGNLTDQELGNLLVSGSATFNAAHGTSTDTVRTDADQTYSGGVTLGADARFNSLSGGNISFNSTLNGSGGNRDLIVNTGGTTTFGGTVGGMIDDLTTDAGGSTNINANITTVDDQTYGDDVVFGFSGSTTLTTTGPSGLVWFQGAISESMAETVDLTIASPARLGDGQADAMTLNSLVITGAATLDTTGTISTQDGQNYQGAVTLAASTTLNNDDSPSVVQFDSTVGGAFSLSITGTAGDAVFNGRVGDTSPLTSLSVAGTTALNAAGDDTNESVQTTGGQTYSSDVTLGGLSGDDIYLESTGGGAIYFGALVDSFLAADDHGLTIETSGTTTFFDAVGNNERLAFLTTLAGGSTLLGGGSAAVNTIGDQTYGDAVVIISEPTTLDSSGGAIRFNSTLDSDSLGRYSLTINATDATLGGVYFGNGGADHVGGSNPFGSLTVTSPLIVFNIAGVTSVKTQGDIGPGADGTQTYNGTVQLETDTSMQALDAAGTTRVDITFNGDITSTADGQDILALDGNVTFGDGTDGNVGTGTNRLQSLHVLGTTLFNGPDPQSVFTTGVQDYSGDVTLNVDVNLQANTGSDITFGGLVDGDGAGSGDEALAIVQADAVFNGLVGSLDPLESIDVDGTTHFNAIGTLATPSVSTISYQAYVGAVTLGATTILQTDIIAMFLGEGDVVFGSTINGAQTLDIVTLQDGDVFFMGNIGTTTRLTGLIASGGTIFIDGTAVRTEDGDILLDGDVELGATITFDTSSVGNAGSFAVTPGSDIYATFTNTDLTIDTRGSGGSGDGGDVTLYALTDGCACGEFLNDVVIETAGTSAVNGTVTLNDDIQLDTYSDASRFTVTGGLVEIAASLTIDTVASSGGVGGPVDLTSVSATTASVSLSIFTGGDGADNGNITVDGFDNAGGNYLHNLTLDSYEDFVGTGGTITLQNVGPGLTISGGLTVDAGLDFVTQTGANMTTGTIAGNVSISAQDDVSLSGNLDATAGTVLVVAGDNFSQANGTQIVTTSSATPAIDITAGGTVNLALVQAGTNARIEIESTTESIGDSNGGLDNVIIPGTTGHLVLRSVTGTSELETQVSQFSAANTGSTGSILLLNSGPLTIVAFAPLIGVTNASNNGQIRITVIEDDLASNDDITLAAGATISTTGTGDRDITLRAGDNIYVNNATGVISTTANEGEINLQAAFGDTDSDMGTVLYLTSVINTGGGLLMEGLFLNITNDLTSNEDMTLRAKEEDGATDNTLVVTGGVQLVVTGLATAGGTLRLRAGDDLTINPGTMATPTLLQAQNPNAVTGKGTVSVWAGFEVPNPDGVGELFSGGKIDAAGNVGNRAYENVNLGDATVTTNNIVAGGTVFLESVTGSIIDANAGSNNITANGLQVDGAVNVGASGNPLEFNVATIATTTTGDQYLAEFDTVNIVTGLTTTTGTIYLENGEFLLSASDLVSDTPLVVNSPAIFDLVTFNETLGSLAGDGEVQLGGGTLTTGATTSQFDGKITGSGALLKTGAGVFTLGSTSTLSFTGTTTVSGGSLIVDGTSGSGNAFTVDTTGVLGGSGTIDGAVNVNALPATGGTLSPGSSIATLTTGPLTLTGPGGNLVIEISNTSSDQVVADSVSLVSSPVLNIIVNTAPASYPQSYTIVDNQDTNPVSGTFAGLPEGAIFVVNTGLNSYLFSITYAGGLDGKDIVLNAISAARVWDGGGTDDNWSTGANWVGDNPPVAGDAIIFNLVTAARLTPVNNLGLVFDSILIMDTANQVYTIGSTTDIQLSGNGIKVDEDDAGAQSITGNVNFVTNAQNIEVNSGSFALTMSGVVSGSVNLTKIGDAQLTLSGGSPNTLSGSFTVNQGKVVLSKTAGVNAIAGALIIGDADVATEEVELNADNQIANTSTVTVNSTGLFDLNNKSDTVGATTVNDGSITIKGGTLNVASLTMTGGTVSSTGVGELQLSGNVTTNASANTATIQGTLNLGAVTRLFSVEDGASTIDLDINGTITGTTGLTLQGNNATAGVMRFRGTNANTYNGLTTVNEGELRLNKGVMDGAFAGNLQVGDGTGATSTAFVRLSSSNQISSSSTINVLSDGEFALGGNSDTTGSVTTAGVVDTGTAGMLVVSGNISHTAGNVIARQGGSISASGTWTQSGGNSILNDAVFNSSGGVVTAGGTFYPNSGFSLTGGQLRGTGGEIVGNVTNSGGSIRPGNNNNIGALKVTGNWTQTAGDLQIELTGTNPGTPNTSSLQFDRLFITGVASFGGTLNVLRRSPYDVTPPDYPDSFSIITFGSRAQVSSTVPTDFSTYTGTGTSTPFGSPSRYFVPTWTPTANSTSLVLNTMRAATAVVPASTIQVFLGGLVKNNATGRWTYTLTVKNNTASTYNKPVILVISNISAGNTLYSSSGTTPAAPAVSGIPANAQYIVFRQAAMTAGQQVSLGALEFYRGTGTPPPLTFTITVIDGIPT